MFISDLDSDVREVFRVWPLDCRPDLIHNKSSPEYKAGRRQGWLRIVGASIFWPSDTGLTASDLHIYPGKVVRSIPVVYQQR